MANDFVKIQSQLEPDDDEKKKQESENKTSKSSSQSLASKVTNAGINGVGNIFSKSAKAVAGFGSKALAVTMTLAQTATVATTAIAGGVTMGAFVTGGSIMASTSVTDGMLDDIKSDDPYACLDEYSAAYKGVFGTINANPLAEQNTVVVTRLREINEMSKNFVGQRVTSKLVCAEEDCPYYNKVGCTDASHRVKENQNAAESVLNNGGKIDLAYVKRIHSFLSAYGLTDVQIAAICGTAMAESNIDFTAMEGYFGHYGVDPSYKTAEYGFKAWAEGMYDSPVKTPTCIHDLARFPYSGADNPINYAKYSSEYPAIQKLGIGLIQFTDGPGFYNNTFLRNYADELNDKVQLIQRIVEGSNLWQDELRKNAANQYILAYGAEGTIRGTATEYLEKIYEGPSSDENKSTGWKYKLSWDEYEEINKALTKNIDDYNDSVAVYLSTQKELLDFDLQHHDIIKKVTTTPVYNIVFEKHEANDLTKYMTNNNLNGDYVDIFFPNTQATCGAVDKSMNYVEYTGNPSGDKNNIDVVFRQAEPIYADEEIEKVLSISVTQSTILPTILDKPSDTQPIKPEYPNKPVHPSKPEYPIEPECPSEPEYPTKPTLESCGGNKAKFDKAMAKYKAKCAAIDAKYEQALNDYTDAMAAYNAECDDIDDAYGQVSSDYTNAMAKYNAECKAIDDAYKQALSDYKNAMAAYNASVAEYNRVLNLVNTEKDKLTALINKYNEAVNGLSKYDDIKENKVLYDNAVNAFNGQSFNHATQVVRAYNAMQDSYTAAGFNFEDTIRNASLNNDVFSKIEWYTEAVYTFEFTDSVNKILDADGRDADSTMFKDLFNKETDAQELRLYYELWQNYAKYETDLPHNGKYINWWLADVQLLFLVGGSYDKESGQGLEIREEYRKQLCTQCSQPPERDTTGAFYYNWLSTWKGDDYTGRDIASATENFYYSIVSGGFDDGTLTRRTEFAYAFYYMFQYDTPYQQAIEYASVGGEATDIMQEMIAEGRWQTNMSNTLSDTAMPHNDKWKEFQTNTISRQWDIDTSTSMSQSMLSILGATQNKSQVNLLNSVWNGCRYLNFINNSTIANAAMYLVDDPLIYGSKDDKFYIMKYGVNPEPEPAPISDLYKVVYMGINKRLEESGKQSMGDESMLSDGFTFVKTSILWSGMDKEFENLNNINDLKKYLKESSSSIYQGESEYQSDPSIGRGNNRIWEQRRLGPYYNADGDVYYEYKWVLVPRVLHTRNSSSSWRADMINEENSENHIDDVNNTPDGGYLRELNENGQTADWSRIDWECSDPDCEICHGHGGHGNTDLLLPGDIIVGDDTVFLWLDERTIQSMYPLESASNSKLLYAGGDAGHKLKAMGEGFEWSKPCDSYINRDTPCPVHDSVLSLNPSAIMPDSCEPYNPDGKWTVYRLSVSNYTDAYRNVGIVFDATSDIDWEIWIKYNWKGMDGFQGGPQSKKYLDELRKHLGVDI